MKVELRENANLVAAKARRYPQKGRKFMQTAKAKCFAAAVLAYIMIRRWRGYRGQRQAIKIISHVLQETDLAPSPLTEQFSCPDEEMILNSHANHASEASRSTKGSGNIPLTHVGILWIPESDAELQMKLLDDVA